MTAKAILGVIPIMQSAHLLGSMKKKKGKPFKPVRSAAQILVGIPLIKATANQIGSY